MDETPYEPPPEPGERIERTEVVERTPAVEPVRAATPMWMWLLPLVLVVGALAWFILTSGEPRSPADAFEDIEIEAPAAEVPETQIEIEAPRFEAPDNDIDIELPERQTPAPEPATPIPPNG